MRKPARVRILNVQPAAQDASGAPTWNVTFSVADGSNHAMTIIVPVIASASSDPADVVAVGWRTMQHLSGIIAATSEALPPPQAD
ncbi:hypothetical protein ACIQW5_10565 [Methylorubrum thiocyanatum]|jgi:hypothetical protein|uniref:hypothetical protein n=1 Tax=Methylorubrum TaxID=2282523 RepID=UPI00015D2A44|nr:hypothetical protein [Methylorubrum populi]